MRRRVLPRLQERSTKLLAKARPRRQHDEPLRRRGPDLPETLAPRAALHERPPTRAGAGVRLGLVGDPPAWFVGWARTARVSVEWAGAFAERFGSSVDALLVDAAAATESPDAIQQLAAHVKDMDGRVICFAPADQRPVDVVDLVVTARPQKPVDPPGAVQRVAMAEPVDPRVLNPSGYRPRADGPLGILVDLPADSDAWSVARRRVADLGDKETVAIFSPHADARGAVLGTSFHVVASEPAERISALRPAAGIVDDPAFHRDHPSHAHRLISLSAAGIPVWAQWLPWQVRELIGGELADLISRARPSALRDPYEQERLSVSLRRIALEQHSLEARWRQIADRVALPTRRRRVSAIMATNRLEYLHKAVSQMSAQRYADMEMIIVLHGIDPGGEARRRVIADASIPVQIVDVDARVTLGDALNAAVSVAGGDVITKVDDDDWYGADHVGDLLAALEYSGATLVGKAAEFIYMGAADITLRRFAGKAERVDRNLAGGTLMISREDLAAVGGWRRVRRAVDQRLMDDVIGSGGLPYRTHGFGFVLNRHGYGHTWDSDVDYFLRQASLQRRGLALDLAGVEDVAISDGVVPSGGRS